MALLGVAEKERSSFVATMKTRLNEETSLDRENMSIEPPQSQWLLIPSAKESCWSLGCSVIDQSYVTLVLLLPVGRIPEVVAEGLLFAPMKWVRRLGV